RHLILPQLGEAGQLKLKAAKVLVIGAGGLGSPLLQYLAAAGVGTIGIVDPDRVSHSNLQRQILYGESDLGELKVEAAKRRIKDLNPLVEVRTHPVYFSRKNAMQLLAEYDIVADGTDNFPTRYLVNDACLLSDKPYVYGSIFRFEGQVSVFNGLKPDGTRGPNYRHLYPSPPPPDQVPNCAEGGVLGVLPGIIGSMQANEVIKIIAGIGDPLVGRLLLFDAAYFSSRVLRIPPTAPIEITELIDYEQFCGLPAREAIPSIDAAVYLKMKAENRPFTLLDVRSQREYDQQNLGGQLIPLEILLEGAMDEIPTTRPLVVHCHSGARSTRAVHYLLEQGLTQVYNLEGGILAVNA
ncbi:MAG: ThiF family adenylyltransferase, partial [Bacteroidota bacterium]